MKRRYMVLALMPAVTVVIPPVVWAVMVLKVTTGHPLTSAGLVAWPPLLLSFVYPEFVGRILRQPRGVAPFLLLLSLLCALLLLLAPVLVPEGAHSGPKKYDANLQGCGLLSSSGSTSSR
eukprot:TRINITY_DN29014_c0_g1_i1.p1 TRINITY_DN29014_c0_g1~~TRINITY_DN29014_c0_g1_i1.p1  ORF type:complete len:120 (-),score=11.68 TRINITY_DN29014_c0_g1_i1:20-379(-)